MIYGGTSTDDARFDQTFPNRNGRIQVCDGSSPITIGLEWRQTPGLIHLKDALPSGKEL